MGGSESQQSGLPPSDLLHNFLKSSLGLMQWRRLFGCLFTFWDKALLDRLCHADCPWIHGDSAASASRGLGLWVSRPCSAFMWYPNICLIRRGNGDSNLWLLVSASSLELQVSSPPVLPVAFLHSIYIIHGLPLFARRIHIMWKWITTDLLWCIIYSPWEPSRHRGSER